MEEDSKTHRSPVSCLAWNAGGDRLISADEHGKASDLLAAVHECVADIRPPCFCSSLCGRQTDSCAPSMWSPMRSSPGVASRYEVNAVNATSPDVHVASPKISYF